MFFSFIANLKCTPANWQMYPWGYMYPRLGTPCSACCVGADLF